MRLMCECVRVFAWKDEKQIKKSMKEREKQREGEIERERDKEREREGEKRERERDGEREPISFLFAPVVFSRCFTHTKYSISLSTNILNVSFLKMALIFTSPQ